MRTARLGSSVASLLFAGSLIAGTAQAQQGQQGRGRGDDHEQHVSPQEQQQRIDEQRKRQTQYQQTLAKQVKTEQQHVADLQKQKRGSEAAIHQQYIANLQQQQARASQQHDYAHSLLHDAGLISLSRRFVVPSDESVRRRPASPSGQPRLSAGLRSRACRSPRRLEVELSEIVCLPGRELRLRRQLYPAGRLQHLFPRRLSPRLRGWVRQSPAVRLARERNADDPGRLDDDDSRFVIAPLATSHERLHTGPTHCVSALCRSLLSRDVRAFDCPPTRSARRTPARYRRPLASRCRLSAHARGSAFRQSRSFPCCAFAA